MTCRRMYICSMTFKELTNDLMLQGWRVYYIPDVASFVKGYQLNTMAIRNLLEIQIYEGKNLVFVKTYYPPYEDRQNKSDDKKVH